MFNRRINLKTFTFFLTCIFLPPLAAAEIPDNARVTLKDVTATLVFQNQLPPSTGNTLNNALEIISINGKLSLNNTITLEVKNLSNYLAQDQRDIKNFFLYLDWHKINGITPRSTGENLITFDIQRTAESKKEWIALLGKPLSERKGFTKEVTVSIGYGDEKPIPGKIHKLQIIKTMGFYTFLGFFIIATGLFFWLARKTPMMRDMGLIKHAEFKTYSLARTQMAFWFFMISISYVFIFLITFEINSIPSSVFLLMGISSLTAIGAVVVDKNKDNRDNAEEQKKPDIADQKKLEIENFNAIVDQLKIALKKRKKTSEETKTALIEKFNASIEALKLLGLNLEWSTFTKKVLYGGENGFFAGIIQETCKFFNDILSDENGISFHRFQMIVWTIILGGVFLFNIHENLTMPEFDENLLVLMGISNGTYIGLKIPE